MQGERTRDRVQDDVVAWGGSEDAARAIVLVGSRSSDPDRVDELSDYDVVVFHSHPAELAGDAGWVERFADVLVELERAVRGEILFARYSAEPVTRYRLLELRTRWEEGRGWTPDA